MPIEEFPPRFVPTLTEVVTEQTDIEPAAPAPSSTADAVAAALLRRIGPDLDRRISEAIARALHEQMLGLNSRVRKAVADVVREAVAHSLGQTTPPEAANKG